MASHWIPEDDFRLRKSIENGASLESLAKGAVKFSRRFTLSELRDRWHSLLYNPHVTSLSSSVAFDHRYSDQFLPQTRHHITPVRSQYYTACKRRRLEEEMYPVSNVDNNVINEELDHVAFGGNAFEGSEYFDMEFDAVDLAIIQNSFPGIMPQEADDGDDGGMVNQLFNDCDVSDTTTAAEALEQFLLQEDPMVVQSFNETTSVSHDQAETWIDPESLPSQPKEYCHNNAMSSPEWDPHPEVINGVIICTLNKESDEIPNNDDIDFTLYKQKARNLSSSSSLRKHMRPPPYPNRGSSSTSSQARGNSDMYQSSGTEDSVVTEQASCSNAFKASYTEKATSSFTTTTSASQQHHEQTTLSSEMDISTPMLQEEEGNNEIESDEDLPSYSDVEAMILDMDLEPIGQDRYELEASRYRNEEVARMIMRLEQCSKSYMNRNITSHEAFAMLYGSSKHYINKPEVLLGRATGEYQVDIDLAKSGSWKKVSRRQALIKLKKDGCFVIKNLGKFSIWINEMEVQHGEIVNLMNNSLIQIREMSFIFETNEKAVKRYLDGIHK